MQIKLFFPGASGSNDKHLRERGLEDLCRDCGADWESIPAGRGPDDARSAGMVATWKTGDPRLDAPDGIPANFEWVPCPPKRDYWFGINPDSRPGPAELARKSQLPGINIELSDFRKWTIPIARGVPYSVGIDYETGEPTAVADKRFEKYSARTFVHATLLAEREEQIASLEKVFFGVKLSDEEMAALYFRNQSQFVNVSTLDEISQQLSVAVLFEEALEHAVDALSINYRLNQFMILHLKLLEVSTKRNHLRDICLAAMEAGEIVESLKKNEMEHTISLLDG